MAKITQYSRISHHTLAGSASATFSVPTSDDFTDGSWTPNDLALSEIGVNEDAGKAYIRIGNDIKELEFTGGTAGAESLATTLAVGNTTGPNHIYFDDGYGIWNNTATAFIRFNDTPGQEITYNVNNGTASTDITHTSNNYSIFTNEGVKNVYIAQTPNIIELQADINSSTASVFQVKPNEIYFDTQDSTGFLGSGLSATMSGVNVRVSDMNYGQTSSIDMTKNSIYVGYITDNDAWYSNMNIDGTAPETKIETGYNSGNLLGRVRTQPGIVGVYAGNATSSTYVSETTTNTSWRVLRVENNIERSEIEVKADGVNHLVNINQTNFMFGTTSTTGFASASIAILDLPNTGDHCWMKVQVKAISSTFSAGYVADIFGGFRNDGSPNLIGTGYSVIEYTDFASGAQAYLDINSTQVRVRGLGQTGSTITWSANLTWG